ncbi:probable multidrug resistance-associated protein lethal(2)03659 isoform X2 [Diabrotica undecimpunctata]|uniref:probable multidrug resistance-associated protein lethal(2)03659 isoform X2 n=1 Tax=Diabrotica undecimpunctata TaxID=50387 RepID=UPI003B63F6D5
MDHCRISKRRKNPKETANIFSVLTFAYIGGIYKQAFKKDLEDEDLYEVPKSCNSGRCGDKLEKIWVIEKEKSNKADKHIIVPRVLWKRWGKKYLVLGILDFVVTTTSSIIQPYAISNLIAYFKTGQKSISKNDAYFYASLVLLQNIVRMVYRHNFTLYFQTFGIEVKTAFSSLLYRKALRLTPAALSEISLGNIVTLITKDVQTLRMSIWLFNEIWIAITQILVICVLLYMKIGLISFAGIGILLAAIPLEAYFSKMVTSSRLQTNKKTDQRLELTQEVLSTIRIIKMHTWEEFFMKKITDARRKEISKLLKTLILKTFIVLTGGIFSRLGFYLLLMACIWSSVSTDTAVIFYAMSNYKDLSHWLGHALPHTFGMAGEFLSAYKRIIKALEAEEFETEIREQDTQINNTFIKMNEVTVVLKEETLLNKVNFEITSGLTLVTGEVGAGKSSILKAILHDLPITAGSLKINGKISFASQDPWLFPSSIKQNILFGQEYNDARYQEVIKACALLYDFNLFENGDETIVTDRGLNLSKGQQARINLARAIYRDADIYLLDDCLTALDISVQEYIFQNCIKTFLKHKICILVSHISSHIEQANNILIMQEGKVKYFGIPHTYLLNAIINLPAEDLQKNINQENNENGCDEETNLLEAEQIRSEKKIYREVKKKGSVNINVYTKYVLFGGGFLYLLVNVIGGGCSQFVTSYSEKLLTKWVDKKESVLTLKDKLAHTNTTGFNISQISEAEAVEAATFKLYSIMLVMSSSLDFLVLFLMLDFCRRASVNIHKEMIKNIFSAIMTFFDTHFIGNILNRFSQDLVNIDEVLPRVIRVCKSVTFRISGSLILIMSVHPQFGIYIVIMFVLLLTLRWIYMPAGRSLKRLEASARSPMIGHLNSTLEGLTTIRACKVQNILIDEFDRHQDVYTSAHFLSICSSKALGFFMDSVCTFFVVAVVAKFAFFTTDSTAGEVGLVLTQVFGLGRTIQWGIREWAELENLMTSTERLLEYTELKKEKSEGEKLDNWPSKGSIVYERVCLSYQNSNELVLNNLNFNIQPKEKIGIVGRTGAGTIRSNLDPFNEFTDEDIWTCLEKVGIKNYINDLYQLVNSNSLSFSAGQKQLICLARAILHKNIILIMDEATANMDPETDKTIYSIIRQNFHNSTILSIAHRLESILEYDKIMVLDRGELLEFDTPENLLTNTDSIFYNMVKQSGLVHE